MKLIIMKKQTKEKKQLDIEIHTKQANIRNAMFPAPPYFR